VISGSEETQIETVMQRSVKEKKDSGQVRPMVEQRFRN
jgi:hypothetical protein